MALRHTLNAKLDGLFTFQILCTIFFRVLCKEINTDSFCITMTLRHAKRLGHPCGVLCENDKNFHLGNSLLAFFSRH